MNKGVKKILLSLKEENAIPENSVLSLSYLAFFVPAAELCS